MNAGAKRFGLFHHDPWKTDPEIDRMVEHCCKIAKKSGIEMECFAVGSNMSLKV